LIDNAVFKLYNSFNPAKEDKEMVGRELHTMFCT
jgi:hypothetical protein